MKSLTDFAAIVSLVVLVVVPLVLDAYLYVQNRKSAQ